MVYTIKHKLGNNLWKATIIEQDEVLKMAAENNLNVEECESILDDGEKLELNGYQFFQKRPFYGIATHLDFKIPNEPVLWIEVIENLDANYLMDQKHCEAVLNSKEYAYQIIETHKLMGRYHENIKIIETSMTKE